ncbi:Crp/Fnr family transcriptional regulator [Klebsiella aerogenes]|mgnify:FL=1|jgi:CRP-like cAMP-binding protein|uniref:winged helix-turn-helix transcriptional regulator n=1 Tax=Klebsiella TaxID=570 RepID=UPI0005EF63A2|nr:MULTISPECIES: winged helix-turn-helix transcriptional regulator [Klebsiella]AWD02927.1 Crp/Fnr family transcriptional regulator [Klebsiella aerogenes]EKU6609854.1 helix-turn-helix domain-containing protein [Klebsiella aerogenes]EKU8183795.1 helix-turn-helix domain-containing protein [Klebsiella aerogenes]EKW5854718.1 helix-turn-helix domain-containing protein [Klebsiella aerogenes]EKW8534746.1 helix-turn-helix domain-containing protein [Klebsiella aerogenes]
MNIKPPVRPQDAINRLMAMLEPHATPINMVARKRLSWEYKGKIQLYLFKKGELSIFRSSDRLLMVTVYEPHLFGVAEMLQPSRSHGLRAEVDTEILRIDSDKAMQLFSEHNMWEEVTRLLAYHTSYLVYRDDLVLQQRTYSVIRNHLMEMLLLPEETRSRVSMLEYIQDRTHLSRSSILNVLSALKKGGYIEFARGGYLQSITSLPEKF